MHNESEEIGVKVYSGDPEAYKAKQEAELEKRKRRLFSMIGKAMTEYQLAGDRWALMRAVYGLAEVCIAHVNPRDLEHLRFTLSWIDKLTPREFMLVFPPAKEYKGSKIGCKDYFSTMELLNDYEPDKPLGDRAIEFVFGYYNRKVCCLGAKIMKAVSWVHWRQTGRDILDDFMESVGKPPLTKYHMHTDSQGRQYAVGTDGTIARVRKHTQLQLVKG